MTNLVLSPYAEELEMETLNVAKAGRPDRINSQRKKIDQAADVQVQDISNDEREYLISILFHRSPHA